ncbi:MAG: S-layer homology domain-containing protein [Candidatus Saganbacteria bacterium]|nr:S-layer homology domain-containing protein [Candidatus Saganbacteria bacterium]
MKKAAVCILALVLALPLLAAAQAVATPEADGFNDLSAQDSAYPYIQRMVEAKIISGYPDQTFRGGNTITRAEFSKVAAGAVSYLETSGHTVLAALSTGQISFKDLNDKHWAYSYVMELVSRYKLLTGYPDGTFQPKKTITRYEVATVLGKMLGLLNMPVPPLASGEALPTDVKADHWALKDVRSLVKLGIMATDQENDFRGSQNATRTEVAVALAKLIEAAGAPVSKVKIAAPALIAKAVEIPSKAQASIFGGYGNVYENASGTNNWRNISLGLTYDDAFQFWRLSGNYELSGRFSYNQIVYLVPGSGGGTVGALDDESRYELELNTTYPVADFWGITGKLLLGAKYINLVNQTAPTNFTGFNAGLATAARAFGRNLLLQGFWSLPLARASVSPSVLGQPAQLFDYEASIDSVLFNYPVLLGLTGELMTFTNTGSRYYNLAFVRYYLF